MPELKLRIAAGTNVGLIRPNNEDNFVVCPDLSASVWTIPQVGDAADLGNLGALLVVADGMGGANAGEVASAIAIETIQQMFVPDEITTLVGDDKLIQEFLKEVVKTADMNIYQHSQSDTATEGMGTTVVMAWILGHRVYVCWCGDSRCYVFSPEKSTLERISKDHSYVQELVDHGELNPEYASDHPLSNIITRCLGDREKRAVPDTRIYELHHGDIVMLCSDGLCGLCKDSQIAEVMAQYGDTPATLKDELISAALSAGGHDNVTVALCCVEREEDATGSAPNTEEANEGIDEVKEDGTAEELSTTVQAEPVSGKHHHYRLWIVVLLLVIAAIAAWVVNTYYYKFI